MLKHKLITLFLNSNYLFIIIIIIIYDYILNIPKVLMLQQKINKFKYSSWAT